MVEQMLHEMHIKVLSTDIYLINVLPLLRILLSIYMKWSPYVKQRRCLIIHLYCVISNLGWYWKGQNFPTETVSSFMILLKIITDFMLLYLSNQLFIFTWFFLKENFCVHWLSTRESLLVWELFKGC